MKHWMSGAFVALGFGVGSLGALRLGVGSLGVVQVQTSPPVASGRQQAKVQVSVVGAVKSPGLYHVDVSQAATKRGLLTAIARAGLGPIDFYTPIKIKRGNATLKAESLQEICKQSAKNLDDHSSVTLQNGDVVVVPVQQGKISFMTAPGASNATPVLKSESISLPVSATLSMRKALAQVGYNPSPGKIYRIRVVRGIQTLNVDLTSRADPKHDFMLRDADTVMISLEPPHHFMILGNVKSIGLHDFPNTAKLTLAHAVKLAGGLDDGRADNVVALTRVDKWHQKILVAQLPSSLDFKNPKWKRQVQDSDLILVYPKDRVASILSPKPHKSPGWVFLSG